MEKVYNSTIGREITSEEISGEINKVMNILYKDLKYYDINDMMGISFNKRLKRALGRTIRKGGVYTMQFNTTFLSVASEENIQNVIAHECIHLIPGCWDHKEKFKIVANKLGKYGYDIHRSLRDENYRAVRDEAIKEKGYYYGKCRKCGTTFAKKYNFTKMYKEVSTGKHSYHCCVCGSKDLMVFHHDPTGIETQILRVSI